MHLPVAPRVPSLLARLLAPLLLFASACDGGVKVGDDTGPVGSDYVDADADGYLASVDCDDAQASVHPGADDVVGDGIDQDCDGADATDAGDSGDTGPDLVDADGDGATSAVDCADDDPSIHPGAEDIPGDHIDQDCDGADDAPPPTDADGDGALASIDCNDGDPTIYPGAPDTAGDGIDQDCDGADATAVAGDADADGVDDRLDCDDANAAVYPGAAEVWYDGIDEACDGGDDEDQDGDGVDRGDDCDDTSDTIYPGAPEVTGDHIDQDCDGADLAALTTLAAGELILTEIMNKPDAVADDYGEWFEVHNASGAPVDLDGLVVTNELGETYTIATQVPVATDGYAVLGRDGDTAVNGGVTLDYDYPSNLVLPNDRGTITLAVSGTTLDTVSWDQDLYFPDTDAYSMSLDTAHIDATDNDEGQYWCGGTSTFGSGDVGTPGAANDTCPDMNDSDGDGWVAAWDCDDSARSIHPGATETGWDGVDSDCDGADSAVTDLRSGYLVITEIMSNPNAVSDTAGEWFEVYNTRSTSVNLDGLVVADAGTDTFTVDQDVVVAGTGRVVFAANGDATLNGGVTTVDYDYPASAMVLGNGSDSLSLYNGGTLIDSVTWDNGLTFPDDAGFAMSLKASVLSATGNDTGSSWCDSSSHIGGDAANDFGTPGTANTGC